MCVYVLIMYTYVYACVCERNLRVWRYTWVPLFVPFDLWFNNVTNRDTSYYWLLNIKERKVRKHLNKNEIDIKDVQNSTCIMGTSKNFNMIFSLVQQVFESLYHSLIQLALSGSTIDTIKFKEDILRESDS